MPFIILVHIFSGDALRNKPSLSIKAIFFKCHSFRSNTHLKKIQVGG